MGENITTETIMGSGASPSIHANDLELLVSGIFSIALNLRSTIMSTTIVSIATITVLIVHQSGYLLITPRVRYICRFYHEDFLRERCRRLRLECEKLCPSPFLLISSLETKTLSTSTSKIQYSTQLIIKIFIVFGFKYLDASPFLH